MALRFLSVCFRGNDKSRDGRELATRKSRNFQVKSRNFRNPSDEVVRKESFERVLPNFPAAQEVPRKSILRRDASGRAEKGGEAIGNLHYERTGKLENRDECSFILDRLLLAGVSASRREAKKSTKAAEKLQCLVDWRQFLLHAASFLQFTLKL